MPTLASDSEDAKRIDQALQEWRQGDLALEEQWFIHVGDASEPLTETAAGADVSLTSMACPSALET